MKILAIRIKNLASLEGITEVDFTVEPLSTAGIFAITGPTGSGKSTLLDALCLALFAKTPRHENGKESDVKLQDGGTNTITQNDVKGILRKGCGEGYAEVDFVGIDNNHYRSNWTVNRARNNIGGALQPDKIQLTNLTEDRVFPETRKTVLLKEIEQLIGLNFAQFTRSVLLAQGEFTAFLKADKNEKSALLEKLTGTEIYSEISIKIYQNYSAAELEYRLVEAEMGGIQLLSKAEQTELNLQKAALSTNSIKLEDEILKVVNDMNWHVTITNLTQYKTAAKEALDICENEKVNAKDRNTTFNLVEAVQPARAIFTEKIALKQQITDINKSLIDLNNSIEVLNIKKATATSSLSTASANLLKKETDYKGAAPQIDEAKALDVVLQEKNKQLTTVATEASEATTNKLQQEKITADKQQDIELTTATTDQLQTWKNNNILRQPIAENHAIIHAQLADAGKLVKQQKDYENNLTGNQGKLEKVITSIKQIKTEVELSTIKIEKLKTVNNTNKQAIDLINFDDIKATENILRAVINKIVPATACWNILHTNQQALESIIKKLLLNSNEIDSKKIFLAKQNSNLKIASGRQDLAEKILNEAILQTQASVVDMRAQLTTESPCPVCGSKDHPFINDNPALNNVIDSLKKEDTDCKKTYKEVLVYCNTISTEISNIEGNNISLEKEKTAIEIKLSSQNKTWVSFNMDAACLAISTDERLLWLQEQESKLTAQQIVNDQELTNYEQLKDKILVQQTEISTAENQLLQSQGLLNNNEQGQTFIAIELKRIQEELNNCTKNIKTITTQLDVFFNDKDWQNKWQMDALGFIEKIDKFTTDWNSNLTALTNGEINLKNLQTELKGFKTMQQSLNANATNLNTKKESTDKELSIIAQQRKALFNGAPIANVVQQFLQQIEQAKINVNTSTVENVAINNEVIKADSNKANLEKQVQTFFEQIEVNSALILKWINAHNETNPSILDEISITNLLAYPLIWISEERNALNLLDVAITKAMTTFTDKDLSLAEFASKKIPNDTAAFLAIRHPEIQLLIKSCHEELTEIDYKFKTHTDKQTTLGNLIAEADIKKEIYQNWHKLNDVIGSSDGKKFRQFAQEYTLDILLGFSNIHLAELANRYKLSRVPNSLALQVLDRDMGDEIRSVHSLSGGESFLVSLALALGLSALTSNKMKIESLFIDEGFGSLDPDTLIIAMDALTKLQDQGRKVGVISHVAEMTENISTQIKIIKMANGRSRVDVV